MDVSPLNYGETHEITVRAHYPSGLSMPVSDSVYSRYLYPPSCFYQSGDSLLIACLPLDTNGNIPENLLGLNLYRDMALVDYISCVPEPPPLPIEIAIQEYPEPGIYEYSISAVYDLAPYGYPGDTGESGYLTTPVVIRIGYPLPFLEQWIYGSFETNNWVTYCDNWSLTGQEGQPAPSAQFTWDPIQQNYMLALESFYLEADSLTVGQIFLDYDIKLENVNPTGTEHMSVQVWNWNSQDWVTCSDYSNVDGSLDWFSEHLNITEQAIGKVFKIQFLANGDNSLNILGWFVDNIHIYRECKAPKDLQGWFSYEHQGIVLEWEPSYQPIDQWIHWDDGINSGNSIGTGDQVEFDVAAKWTVSQLTEYEGYEITQIAFFPAETQASYQVRVWTGLDSINLVFDQIVNDPIIGQWNYVTLDSPQMIDMSQDLLVGYHVSAQTGYPAGVDDGPAIDGYGNMMNFGGWQTLLQINPALDYNWNIQAYIQRELVPDTLTKYAIYRSDAGRPYYFRQYTEIEEFIDDSAILLNNCPFFYYVTAIYSSEMDSCESGPSNEVELICEGMMEGANLSDVNIYPNPASDQLTIESSEKIEHVTVYDGRGEEVKGGKGDGETCRRGSGDRGLATGDWRPGEGETCRISVGDLAPGLYLVRIETGGGLVMRKIVVQR